MRHNLAKLNLKSGIFCITSSLLFGLVINSRAEAAIFNVESLLKDAYQNANPVSVWGPVGENFKFLKSTADTGGKYTVADTIVPPGVGPLPHIHRWEDEWFAVIDGTVQIQMGEDYYAPGEIPGINAPKEKVYTINAGPGTLLYGPRDHVHGYRNTGTTSARMLTVWAPSGIENLFKETGLPVTDPSKPPPFDPQRIALFNATGPKYGIDFSSSFDQYVGSVDNNVPADMLDDDHADELVALLSNNATPVPESSYSLGALAFAAFVAISILKRKYKPVS